MSAFHLDTLIEGEGPLFTGRLSPDWEINGPNGGYMAALALRAVGRLADAAHRPVSLSCQYLRRARSDDVEITVARLRGGSSASCYQAELRQDGAAILQAQVWTTDASGGPEGGVWRRSPGPSWQDLKPRESYLPPGVVDRGFLGNFESRPFLRPGATNPDGQIQQAWIRYREFESDGDAFLDQARTLTWIDAGGWPAHVRGGVDTDYAVTSLELSVWFHASSATADWMLLDAEVGHAAGGLLTGHVRMWSEAGQLLAHGSSNMICRPL